MRSIKPHLTPIFEHNQINEKNLVESDGVFIDSFFELRKQMAQLACANSDFILFSEVKKEIIRISYIVKEDLHFFQVYIEEISQMKTYTKNGLN